MCRLHENVPSLMSRFIAHHSVFTVASAPESVFALEGNSVTLNMQWHNKMGTDDAVWVFNQSCYVVRYYPYHEGHSRV